MDPDAVQRVDARGAIASARERPGAPVLVQLGPRDVTRITRLGVESWPAPMRVDTATVARRFELGHVMLGVELGTQLLGVVAFCYTGWSPRGGGLFPATDTEFSSQPRSEPLDTAFAYNLVVHPQMRGGSVTRRLVAAGLARCRQDGCRFVLGHSRCPSYNGSDVPGIEHIEQCAAFRQAIDRSLQDGPAPALAELLLDPVLCFYHRMLRCTFVRVMPDFLPGDVASGGMAIRFVVQLTDAHRRLPPD